MSRFVKLLEPTKIGAVELRNRIVMPAMVTNYANADGSVSDGLMNYHAERAKGGVAADRRSYSGRSCRVRLCR